MFHLGSHGCIFLVTRFVYSTWFYFFDAFNSIDKKLYFSRNMPSLVVRAQRPKQVPARLSIMTATVEVGQ